MQDESVLHGGTLTLVRNPFDALVLSAEASSLHATGDIFYGSLFNCQVLHGEPEFLSLEAWADFCLN